MPRNCIRKSERVTKYSKEDLEIAVEKVKLKGTNYAASKVFNIPPYTLNYRVLATKGLKSGTMGRPPALPKDAETRLVNSLRTLEKWGFG